MKAGIDNTCRNKFVASLKRFVDLSGYGVSYVWVLWNTKNQRLQLSK